MVIVAIEFGEKPVEIVAGDKEVSCPEPLLIEYIDTVELEKLHT
jgi:hypothetical protein